MHSVAAKPFTGPEPQKKRMRPVSKVVRFESKIVESALPKPSLAAWIGFRPFSSSSRNRSKMRMLASIAMPTVNTMPATPGSVSVVCIKRIAPSSNNRLTASEIAVNTPSKR